MTAAVFNCCIQFQRATSNDDGFTAAPTWHGADADNYGAPVRAARTDISDAERWRASEIAAHITTRFVVMRSPFTAGLTPKDRLVCDGRPYNIVGIKEGTGQHQWLEITAAARTDQ